MLAILFAVLFTAIATTAPAARADSSLITGLVKEAHPVILVHGWTGEPLSETRTKLESTMGNGWQFLLFDYTDNNRLWAGDPRIADKLADYIKQVSAAHRRAGGDGLVYLIGHSMGGLAIRFASVKPGVADAIGGVVTVGTPHQGSPWGNASGGAWAKLVELKAGKLFDPPGDNSLARICLAMHDHGKGLPKGCAAPPYFPIGIPVRQIAGSVIVERRYFGFHAYDITIGGDSIVPITSADGYINSAAGKTPTGSYAPVVLSCNIEENAILSVAASEFAVPWQLLSDSGTMDQLMDNKVSPAVAALLVRISLVSDSCAHGVMMTNKPVVDEMANSLKILADKRATERVPTKVITVNPFDASGALKPGYRIDDTQDPIGNVMLDCSYNGPSPAGVTPDTHWCSGLASDEGAFCWSDPTSSDHALCSYDAESKTLYRFSATGLNPTSAAEDPEPMNVELVDGTKWRYRTGGAWSAGPDDMYGTYFCIAKCRSDQDVALVAGDNKPTFTKANGVWKAWVAQLGEQPDKLPPARQVQVKRIWFIGAH